VIGNVDTNNSARCDYHSVTTTPRAIRLYARDADAVLKAAQALNELVEQVAAAEEQPRFHWVHKGKPFYAPE
jgi:hypothetical protein